MLLSLFTNLPVLLDNFPSKGFRIPAKLWAPMRQAVMLKCGGDLHYTPCVTDVVSQVLGQVPVLGVPHIPTQCRAQVLCLPNLS